MLNDGNVNGVLSKYWFILFILLRLFYVKTTITPLFIVIISINYLSRQQIIILQIIFL